MKKYTITLNGEQAHTVLNALESYARIGMGQFEEIINIADPDFNVDRSKTRSIIHELHRVVTGLPPNASFGIAQECVPIRCRRAYDIYQVLRHKVAWTETPKGGNTVNFHASFLVLKEAPIIVVEAT